MSRKSLQWEAAEQGESDVVKFLIDEGATVDLKDPRGQRGAERRLTPGAASSPKRWRYPENAN